jgi:lipoprotein NlpD
MGKLTGETPFSTVFSCCLPCRKFIGFFLAGLMILSCSGYLVRGNRPHGVYHRVKSGETLSIIARAYHIDLQELAEINNISNPDRIEMDGVIFIPDANQILDDVMTAARPLSAPLSSPAPQRVPPREEKVPAPIPKAVSKPEIPNREAALQVLKHPEASPAEAKVRAPEPSGASEKDLASRRSPAKPEKEEMARISPKPDKKEMADQPVMPAEYGGKTEQIQFDKKRFIWPVKGRVVKKFGIESVTADYSGKKVETAKIMNQGINIAAGEGMAVQAAADGHVIFSGPLKDYGETIIIQHEDQYATVYTRLGIRAVRGETRVKKGDRIAFLGKGEDHVEPYLHFEIRYKNKARNPLFFLP